MTAASNERKRFLSWPRPVCQEPFTRTFAAAPMFHAIWIIIYPVTTSRARRDCRTPSQKPREKKRTRTSSLALARLSANRAKVTQICADSSKRWEDFELLFRIVPPLFLLDLLYYCSFSFFFFFFCVCVCVCLLCCFGVRWEIFIGVDGFRGEVWTNCSNLRYPYYRGRWFGITDSCIKGAFSSYINMLVMGK